MLVLNLPFKALMFLTLMRPSLVLFLVLWLKLVKDFLKRSEERFSRNAETEIVCRLLLEKKNGTRQPIDRRPGVQRMRGAGDPHGSAGGTHRFSGGTERAG